MRNYKNSEQASRITARYRRDSAGSSFTLFFTRFGPPVTKSVIWKFFRPLRKTFPPAALRPARRDKDALQPGSRNVIQGYMPPALRDRHVLTLANISLFDLTRTGHENCLQSRRLFTPDRKSAQRQPKFCCFQPKSFSRQLTSWKRLSQHPKTPGPRK